MIQLHAITLIASVLRHCVGLNVSCQGEINLEELKSKLPEGIELPPSLQNASLPTLDEIKAIVKSKCERVSNSNETYTSIEAAAEEFKICAADLIDFSELQDEMEVAQPKGELDTVFNK